MLIRQLMQKVNFLALAVIVTGSSCAAALAQETVIPQQRASGPDDSQVAQIDQFVQNQLAQLAVPGYHLTVIKNGNVILHRGYGMADIAQRRPVSDYTVFGLASLTKTFTALTLLALVDKGLVSLDDPLQKYLKGLTPEYKNLTIRQLASMTAGVPKTVPNEIRWPDQIEPLIHLPLQSQPGTAFLYSNFSYRLLGSVIETVSGRPYLEMVREVVLAPLGMNNTATTVILERSGMLAQAYGDNSGNGPLRAINYKDPQISFSAGMLATTGNDLVNYVKGLLAQQVLSPDGYKTLWYYRPGLSSGAPSPWAFGWSSNENAALGGKRVISMNGGTPGVASTIMLIPETNSAVIALSNLRKPPVYQIAKSVLRMAFAENANPNASPENANPTGAPENQPGTPRAPGNSNTPAFSEAPNPSFGEMPGMSDEE